MVAELPRRFRAVARPPHL